MLVFVVTPEQFNDAFKQWINKAPTDERKIMNVVFNEFMNSKEAEEFHTVTHLISFPINEWIEKFHQWRDIELFRYPDNEENIRLYTNQLGDLLQSDWGITYKLIVRECLDNNDRLLKNDVN